MQLIETSVTAASVRMRLADADDPLKATQWVDFQVPIAELRVAHQPGGTQPIGDPESEYLSTIRGSALRRAQDVIVAEIRRLEGR